jgi:hypothetical protein
MHKFNVGSKFKNHIAKNQFNFLMLNIYTK